MLTVYRSNRAELLAELLGAQMLLHPPGPFEQGQVVVNSWPTSRWLSEQLAQHLGGIAANLRFPFPGSWLRALVEQLLQERNGERPEGVPPADGDGDPWRATRLVWPLLALLPQLAARPEGKPLRDWLGSRQLDKRLDLASWQLARAIADAFDDYALYRPAMLRAWEAGKDQDGSGRPLAEEQRWQPLLYADLRAQLGVEPFGLRVEWLIAALRSGDGSEGGIGALRGPLRLFGLSSLAPVQIRLLQALSGCLPVEIYLLTPCRDLWQRCTDRRRQISDALALRQPFAEEWLLRAPPLEARFGRLGAEFQQLLEGTGEALLGICQERDLFFAPATVAVERTGSAHLLSQLQEQLADPARLPQLELDPRDHSLEFHACPGPLRQVQIVRDRLLQLLAEDDTLEPRHILVMTPRVDRFAPLVASVFGDSGGTGVTLPWRLTDRSQQSEAGIGRTLLALLTLSGERLTASGLESLLESRPLQERFGLTAEEVGQLNGVLQICGFRWGLDGVERGGDATHSLSWAIDRMLLALVLPSEGPAVGDPPTAPAEGGVPLERTGRWLHLLGRLRHWLFELRRDCDGQAWAQRLPSLLLDLFGDGGEAAWEMPSLLAAIDAWQAAAGDCPLLLEAPVVAAVLDEALSTESGRFGHRSGAITISALEPMRAIPHRVIVLMGLDADSFPRRADRPGFHLMERRRELGDPHPADQDRYVLMEALLSARQHLLISWSNRDDRTGETLPPAVPVRQWQEWLKAQLGDGDFSRLLVEHAASALERSNFQALVDRPPPSCDRRLLLARERLDAVATPPASALLQAPMPTTLPASVDPEAVDPFTDLREWLMAPQKQWLALLGLRPAEWVRQIEDLEALELEERERSALLRDALRSAATAGGLDPPPMAAGDWLSRCRGQGLLPPGAAAQLEVQALEQRWRTLHGRLADLGPPHQEPLVWGSFQAAPERRGDAVVVLHTATERVGHRLDLWLQLLLAAAAPPEGGSAPRRGVLISREKDDFKVTTCLQAPATDGARDELERLASLRQEWGAACWPVPPATGWAWLEAERRHTGSGRWKAAQAWEGDGSHRLPERQQPEMVLCFGADLPIEQLLEGSFKELVASLLDPVLRAAEQGEGNCP